MICEVLIPFFLIISALRNSAMFAKSSVEEQEALSINKISFQFSSTNDFIADGFDPTKFVSPTNRVFIPDMKIKIPMWLIFAAINFVTENVNKSHFKSFAKSFPVLNQISEETSLLIDKMQNRILKHTNSEGELDLACASCDAIISTFFGIIETGKSPKDILSSIIFICIWMNIMSKEACEGIIWTQGTIIINLVKTQDADQQQKILGKFCSNFLARRCKYNEIDLKNEWEVEIPQASKFIEQVKRFSKEGYPLKILHLTDIHLDPLYMKGSLANCRDFACCQVPISNHIYIKNPKPAGKFGDYNFCDVPFVLLESLLRHIRDTHKNISAIYWTGDNPSHDSWNINESSVMFAINSTYQMIKTYLPGIPIFSSIGNHDTHPLNSFPLPEVYPSSPHFVWLYPFLANIFGGDLNESAKRTIRYGAFYATKLNPGLRIIAVNSIICYILNWWSYFDVPDPYGHLQWLVKQLEEAEKLGEKVHILGHIPSGHECQQTWSHQYRRIISRFASTITAQFAGHTHFDEFQIFYDKKNISKPLGTIFLSPSVTPYADLNPGYRIFYVNDENSPMPFTVRNFETWITQLEDANKFGIATWQKLYDANKAYGVQSASPVEMDRLLRRMVSDKDLFQLFFRHWSKNSTSPKLQNCSETCRIDQLCFIVMSDSSDSRHCQQILSAIRRKKSEKIFGFK